jgi:hypothetical protein
MMHLMIHSMQAPLKWSMSNEQCIFRNNLLPHAAATVA